MVKKRTKCDRLVLVAVSRVHNLSLHAWIISYHCCSLCDLLSTVWKYSFKDHKQLTSPVLTVMHISYNLISTMFYDRGNSHQKFLFFLFSHFMNNVPFCSPPTVLLSFYENKHKVIDSCHRLCTFILLYLLFFLSLFLPPPIPGKPAKSEELQSGSVSGS